MALPVVVFCVSFVVGVLASVRWLPELGDGPVAGLAYFVVCGLMGAGLALVVGGVEQTVHVLETSSGKIGRVLVAETIGSIARDAGPVFGLAMTVYLLAPRTRKAPARGEE